MRVPERFFDKLTPNGRQQAKSAGECILHHAGDVDLVVVSGYLFDAYEDTARIIAEVLQVEFTDPLFHHEFDEFALRRVEDNYISRGINHFVCVESQSLLCQLIEKYSDHAMPETEYPDISDVADGSVHLLHLELSQPVGGRISGRTITRL